MSFSWLNSLFFSLYNIPLCITGCLSIHLLNTLLQSFGNYEWTCHELFLPFRFWCSSGLQKVSSLFDDLLPLDCYFTVIVLFLLLSLFLLFSSPVLVQNIFICLFYSYHMLLISLHECFYHPIAFHLKSHNHYICVFWILSTQKFIKQILSELING